MKLSSPAQQSGHLERGDEILQVNYQTVLAWPQSSVISMLHENENEVILTVKRSTCPFTQMPMVSILLRVSKMYLILERMSRRPRHASTNLLLLGGHQNNMYLNKVPNRKSFFERKAKEEKASRERVAGGGANQLVVVSGWMGRGFGSGASAAVPGSSAGSGILNQIVIEEEVVVGGVTVPNNSTAAAEPQTSSAGAAGGDATTADHTGDQDKDMEGGDGAKNGAGEDDDDDDGEQSEGENVIRRVSAAAAAGGANNGASDIGLDDDEKVQASDVRFWKLYPKPKYLIKRRATVTGASPVETRPPVTFINVSVGFLDFCHFLHSYQTYKKIIITKLLNKNRVIAGLEHIAVVASAAPPSERVVNEPTHHLRITVQQYLLRY